MVDSSSLSRNAFRALKRSYRTVNLKTAAVDLVPDLARSLSEIDGARVAYALHVEDGFVDHYHLVAQFPTPQHLLKQFLPIAEADPCFYLRPCRVFRSSYRYLVHLDSPDKKQYPVSDIQRLGDWDGTDLALWHSAKIISCNMQELLSYARDYIRGLEHHETPNPIGFAVFLDQRNVSSRSALSGLRMMDIPFASFIDFAMHSASLLTQQETNTNETDD